MATRKIAFPVVYRRNNNISSKSYGRWFVESRPSDPLLLVGLMQMCAWDQSVYTPEIVQGVIDALSKVMLELMREGQPVKWDKLGCDTGTGSCHPDLQQNGEKGCWFGEKFGGKSN